MKDAFYFPHDSNARNDLRIARLRVRLGWSAYGIYWAIIEVLRDQDNYKMPAGPDMVGLLAISAGAAVADIEPVVNEGLDSGLFVADDEWFWSASLVRRMEANDRRREAGREAAIKGWQERKGRDAYKEPKPTHEGTQGVPNANPDANKGEERRRDRTTAPSGAKGLSKLGLNGNHDQTAAEKAAAEQETLLKMRIPFGELRGVSVGSLPADQASFLLKNTPRLSDQLKRALKLRVDLKAMEAKR